MNGWRKRQSSFYRQIIRRIKNALFVLFEHFLVDEYWYLYSVNGTTLAYNFRPTLRFSSVSFSNWTSDEDNIVATFHSHVQRAFRVVWAQNEWYEWVGSLANLYIFRVPIGSSTGLQVHQNEFLANFCIAQVVQWFHHSLVVRVPAWKMNKFSANISLSPWTKNMQQIMNMNSSQRSCLCKVNIQKELNSKLNNELVAMHTYKQNHTCRTTRTIFGTIEYCSIIE